MYQSVPNRTGEELRAEFERLGLSIADWARAHNYSVALVYQVLAGRKRCRRGKSHEIAVRLGLKQGEIGTNVYDVGAVPGDAPTSQPGRESGGESSNQSEESS